MRVISFGQLKGGVGKSVSSLNVAHGLARVGRRVLLIDLDAYNQTLSNYFPPGGTIYDALTGTPIAECAGEVRPNLFFLRAAAQLAQDGIESERHWRRLTMVLESAAAHDIGVVVLDCPAGWHDACRYSVARSTAVIVPVGATMEALESAHRTRTLIKAMAPKATIKYLLTHYRRSGQAEFIAESKAPWLATRIPRAEAIPALAMRSQTVFDAPAGSARTAYKNLTEELIKVCRL